MQWTITLPAKVRLFFIRLLAFWLLWYVVYYGWLAPQHQLDKALTQATGWGAMQLLPITTGVEGFVMTTNQQPQLGEAASSWVHIWWHDRRLVGLADACNALALMVLYGSFIVAFPARIKQTWVWLIGGTVGIYLINICRIALLATLQWHYPHWQLSLHHWAFNCVVYGLIYWGWTNYAHYATQKK